MVAKRHAQATLKRIGAVYACCMPVAHVSYPGIHFYIYNKGTNRYRSITCIKVDAIT